MARIRQLQLIRFAGVIFLFSLLMGAALFPPGVIRQQPLTPSAATGNNKCFRQSSPTDFLGPEERFIQRPFVLRAKLDKVVDTESFDQLPGKTGSLKNSATFFKRIYRLSVNTGSLRLPMEFKPKVRTMFAAYLGSGDVLQVVEHQKVVVLYNLFTFEETLFNTLRGYRPGYAAALPPEKESELQSNVEKSIEGCDFCNPEHKTAFIKWSTSGLCYVTSNVAKYQGHHALIVPRQHSSLEVTLPLVHDMLSTAKDWFQDVYQHDQRMAYPHIMWDNLPRSSASQYHFHWQASVSPSHYYARTHQVREGAIRYEMLHDSSFWPDVVAVHEELGLAVRHGDAAALAYVTPTKEKELVVLAPSGASVSFGHLLYVAIQTFLQDTNVRALSCGITFEPLDRKLSPYPAIARLVDRGSPFDQRNDVGAMEFFGAYNVASDPYVLVKALQSRLGKSENQFTAFANTQ